MMTKWTFPAPWNTGTITDEKNYQPNIIVAGRKVRLLANSMPFVWTKEDANGNLNYFNQSVYDIRGLPLHGYVRQAGLQIVHLTKRENIKAWTRSWQQAKIFLFEHPLPEYDGEYRWRWAGQFHNEIQQVIFKWVGTSTDIQEMKEQDQQKIIL